jgi:hypothetical protein
LYFSIQFNVCDEIIVWETELFSFFYFHSTLKD